MKYGKNSKLLEKIETMSIGDLANYIYDNGIVSDRMEEAIQLRGESIETVGLIKKVQDAFDRVNSPLSRSMKIFYFFIPFGKITSFTEGYKYLENGYFRKERQCLILSWLGIAFYISVIVISKFLFE